MFCGECGKKISDEAKFCPYCGSPVETEEMEYETVEEPGEQESEYEEVETVFEEKDDIEYEEEKEDSGNAKKIVLIVLLLIALAVAGFFIWKLFFAETENNNLQTTQTTAEPSTADDDGDDVVHDDDAEHAEGTAEGQDDGLPVVYADDSIDYGAPLSPSDYIVYEADEGYSFAYPKNFYNEVYKIDGGYSFTGDDGVSAFEIYEEGNPYTSASEAIEGYYSSAKNSMNVYDEIIYSPDTGKLILVAKNNFDSDIYYYYLVRAYEDDVYVMKVTYPLSSAESKTSENQKNYMVDCMYRYCSFSGGTYKPRTYTQFKNDDMGTKK